MTTETYLRTLARAIVLAPEQSGAGTEWQSLENALFLAAERLMFRKPAHEWTAAEEAQFAARRNDLLAAAERELVEEGVLEPAA
jgi:hypothetical protein